MTVATHVALLRGINVAGHRNVGMAELRSLVASAGCEDVATHLASGNVLFRSTATDPAALAKELEERIAQGLRLDVAVLVRTAGELAAIVARGPGPGADPATLHITFLSEAPERGRLSAIDPDLGLPDTFSIVGREILVHCPNGYGRTKLNNAFFERALGVTATTRTWRTVVKLAGLARA